jgi:pilus assembly protein CpaB
MNKIALVIAAVAALVGLGLLWLYMKRFEEEASGGPPINVVMATQDIPLGTVLTSEMMAIRPMPSVFVEERHIRAEDMEDVIGVRVSLGVKANESILWTDLATTAAESRNLSGLIREGMRAVTIRADVTSNFGGLLRPGDRVDVLITATRAEGGGERVTAPLLQNLIVLAVGQDTGGDDRVRAGPPESEVTLGVTIEQAQILTYARQAGVLTLVLRNFVDIAILEGLPETTREDVLEQERRIRLWRREEPPPRELPVNIGDGQ